ncbi:hypothetical protein [Nocardia sp. NPDC060249]|uniref:hypothetical protein n=1 Tax=Nocardia sp. NPDC060249 TaxID=3347082 RepID=UPI00365BDD2E
MAQYILEEVDPQGRPYLDEANGVEYFDDVDFGGDAGPVAREAWEAATARYGTWRLLRFA